MTNPATIAGYDFHCHVDLHEDPAALIAECERRHIFTLAVTTTPRAWSQNRKWTTTCRYVRAAIGLHPELAAERHREVDLVKLCMRETAFVGEIGLDASPAHRNTLPIQKQVFGAILDEAQAQGGKILTIHSRRSAGEVIGLLRERTTPQRVASILHWFSGSKKELAEGVAAYCMFSINPGMLTSDSGRAVIAALPNDRLLTETDAPFSRYEGRVAEPADVVPITDGIADIRGQSAAAVADIIANNAARLFAFAAARS